MTLAKIGPLRNLKPRLPDSFVFLDHFRARDVGRHQVGRELNAAELQRQGIGQRADHERLGQARHADQQAMPAGEDGDEQFFDHLLLADDHAAQLLADEPIGFVEFLHGLDVVVFEHGSHPHHTIISPRPHLTSQTSIPAPAVLIRP